MLGRIPRTNGNKEGDKEKMIVRPSRRQVVMTMVLYVVACIGLAGIRTPTNVQTEISFYAVFLCLTVLFLFAAGGLADNEEVERVLAKK